jgi:hypothetical protein
VAKRFGITPEPQGRVYGKRVSISQDINRAARQRHAASEGTHRAGGVHLSVQAQRTVYGGTEVYRELTPRLDT